MPRASPHRTPSTCSPAAATTVLRSALRALLVACRGRRALLRASAFQIFSFFLALFALFSFFFGQSKRPFHFFNLFRLQPFGFIFAGGALVDVRIAHRFHQFIAHGDHLVTRLPEHLFFHLLEFGQVQVVFIPRHLAFFFFDLFFFHHALAWRLQRALLLGRWLIANRRRCGMFFFLRSGGLFLFFYLGRSAAKNAGHIHAFKPLFFFAARRVLRHPFRVLCGTRGIGRAVCNLGLCARGLNPMKTAGRFHPGLGFFLLGKLVRNRAG